MGRVGTLEHSRVVIEHLIATGADPNVWDDSGVAALQRVVRTASATRAPLRSLPVRVGAQRIVGRVGVLRNGELRCSEQGCHRTAVHWYDIVALADDGVTEVENLPNPSAVRTIDRRPCARTGNAERAAPVALIRRNGDA